MLLTGKKIGVLVENNYQELELWYPVLRFREAKAEVNIIGPEAKVSYNSKHGYPAVADVSADKVDANEFDAIIIPGGYAPDAMRMHKEMVDLVREAFNKGKVVAAICHAGWMLASAGILEGKKATSYIAIKDDMCNAGAKYIDEEVVRDGNLITSRKPDDLPAFCRAVIEALNGV